MDADILYLLGVFFVAAILGFPIGFSMLGAGIFYLFMTDQDIAIYGAQILSRLSTRIVLIAIPLFIFAANIMNAGTITDRLLNFGTALVGRFRGGMAYANVVTSLIFSGMSGSAVADAAGPGTVLVRMMTRDNRYTPGFAGAVTAASATIGPIIPPSIPMVMYALAANTSVGALFLGGIIPGIMMALALSGAIAFMAWRRNFPTETPVPLRALPRVTMLAFLPLMMPVILLGGIYSGVSTPTEAAAVAGLYALILGVFVYRVLGLRELNRILIQSARGTSVVMMVVSGAFVFNFAIVSEGVPNALAAFISELDLSPLAFMLMINAIFLLLGAVFDVAVLLLVIVPIVIPSVVALEINLIHFGVVIVVNIMLGLVTPPYGMLLFVINAMTGASLSAMIRDIWIFILVLVVALLFMIAFPGIVLWLPRQFGFVN